MDIAILFGASAGVLNIMGFIAYNKQVLRGTSHPNSTTWILWLFINILNASSYSVMSGDWTKSILPLANALACTMTFLFSLCKGKLSKIDLWDGLALSIGMISILIWYYCKSATYANLALQASYVVSFLPTARCVWKNPATEKILPWCLWSLAFAFNIIAILLRWKGHYQDLAYPVINITIVLSVILLVSIPHKNHTTKESAS